MSRLGDSSDMELASQLRGFLRDNIRRRPAQGTVTRVGLGSVNLTLAETGTQLPNVDVIGGTDGLAEGATVYLLHLADERVVALRAGASSSSGSSTAASAAVAATGSIVLLSRQLLVGAGLAGGGSLSADLTFNVGAGDGISVLADSVGVDGTVARSSWQVLAGTGLMGGGALASGGITLNLGAGAGLAASDDAVAVDQAYPFAWSAPQTWSAPARFDGGISAHAGVIAGWQIGPNQLKSPGGGLVLDSTGTLSGNYSAGVRGWMIDQAGNAEFNRVNVRGELHASIFVMDEIHAAGGQIIVRPAGTLYEDVVTV